MRRFCSILIFAGIMASLVHAQAGSPVPLESQLYCSGIVTSDPVPSDTYVISGAESYYRLTYSDGKLVFLNKGASQGVKVGDQFEVIRAARLCPIRMVPRPGQAPQSDGKHLRGRGTASGR
jgi:hypothetical protein